MEGLSMPWLTKRTASAAYQAPPHRPTEPLLLQLWDLQSLGPLFSPTRAELPQTPTPQDPQTLHQTTPLRLPSQWSTGSHNLCSPGPTPLRSAQACTISAPPAHAPKACQTGDPQACTISAPPGPHPSGMPGPHSKGLLDHLNNRPPPTGPWDRIQPSTCHRRALNLPRRHRQV
jgi:hypothetical protein